VVYNEGRSKKRVVLGGSDFASESGRLKEEPRQKRNGSNAIPSRERVTGGRVFSLGQVGTCY